jgi:FKBP-type peptidyl-prolyl cis-trans isomerase FklB
MIKYFFPAVIVMAASLTTSCDKVGSKGSKPSLKTEKDSASYAMGVNIGSDFKGNGLDSLLNTELLFKGIQAGFDSNAVFTKEKSIEILNAYFEKEMNKRMEEQKGKGEKFLNENKSKPGVKVTPSGLQYQVVSEGTGAKPTAASTVTVHYTGTLVDGKVFDSSIERGEPAEFPLAGVIPGWTEGIQLMSVGSKYKFFIPASLAYGEMGQPQGGIGPNEVLIFDVELLNIKK